MKEYKNGALKFTDTELSTIVIALHTTADNFSRYREDYKDRYYSLAEEIEKTLQFVENIGGKFKQ